MQGELNKPNRRTRTGWRVGRLTSRWVLGLLLILAMIAGAMPRQVQAADPPRVLPQLLQEATAKPDETFRVIVARNGQDTAADEYAAAKGHAKIKDVAGVGFVAQVKGRDIAALGTHRAVKHVTLDAAMIPTAAVDNSKLATVYNQTINAVQSWLNGIVGLGVGVAVLDTGINQTLPDFRLGTAKRVVGQALFSSNTTNLSDAHGHGTYVAGIIGGNSWMSSDRTVQGKYVGVAPLVNLISVKVSDDQGMAYVSDVVNAINWVIQNRETYNIRVMNLSMVSSVAESYQTSVLDAAVELAWFNGILVVASAGNGGPDTMYYPPANDPFIMTVGASDPKGTGDRSDDTTISWSSYGVTQDGFSKPDFVAPGRYIISTLTSPNSTLATSVPDRIVDRSYIWLSGTSQSAAVTSGLAALLFQARPDLTNDQVKWLLAETASLLGTGSRNTFTPYPGQGTGLVNLEAAMKYKLKVDSANQGIAISPLLVGPSGETVYSSSSWSTSSWSTSSWSTSSWSTSSWSTSSWATSFTGK